MNKYPFIYRQILKSGLVDSNVLRRVYTQLHARLRELNRTDDEIDEKSTTIELIPGENSPTNSEQKSIDASRENVFELGEFSFSDDSSSASVDFSDASKEISVCLSAPFEEEMTRLLPAELEIQGLVNHWQVSQLLRSRTRFILGGYRIIDSLGQGGYSHVFLGRPLTVTDNRTFSQLGKKLEGDVAIKVLPLALETEKATFKFLREAQIDRGLDHPNIVRFLDASRDGNVHFMVHEYIDGGDVRRLINRYEKLDFRLATAIVNGTAQALHYLHQQGLVHRDVKPGNILLTCDGQVKLIDMGLSVPRKDSDYVVPTELTQRLTQWESEWKWEDEEHQKHYRETEGKKRKVAGTPDYISPDQIRNPEVPSPLWDIYSLGCAFYFMVTGIVPFPAGTTTQKMQAQLYCDPPEPRMFNQGLPEYISKLILAMMAKNPAERVSSAQEVMVRLKPYLSQENVISPYINVSRSEISPTGWEQKTFLPLTFTNHSVSSGNSGQRVDPEPVSASESGNTSLSPMKNSEKAFSDVLTDLADKSTPRDSQTSNFVPTLLPVSENKAKGTFLQRLLNLPSDPVERTERISYLLINWILLPLLWITIAFMFFFLLNSI